MPAVSSSAGVVSSTSWGTLDLESFQPLPNHEFGIHNQEELLGHPVVGASWEGMLVENILDSLPATARPTFYRTSAGAEIDLVIEFNPKERWAIEIKRSLNDPSKQGLLYWLRGFECQPPYYPVSR
jgi:predicted AAA+ superfamily ATPase